MDLYTILGFIGGGGVSAVVTTFINFKYARKTPQLDYTKQLSDFWEDQNKKLLDRFKALEDRVEGLEAMSCERTECKNRIKSIA
jgi:hypothetical protein